MLFRHGEVLGWLPPWSPRYKLCVIATNGTAESEFILFGDIGQHVVGKQVGAILRSNQASDKIPPEIVQVICKKFTWHFSITERSFHGPIKTYQVNRIIAALGRQTSIPSISSSIYTTLCSTQSATTSTNTTTVPWLLSPHVKQAAPLHRRTRFSKTSWKKQLMSYIDSPGDVAASESYKKRAPN